MLDFHGYISSNIYVTITIIIIALTVKYIIVGIYQILIDKYYRNFTNSDIDSKIFSSKAFFNSISNVIFGLIASFLIDRTTTQNTFILLGLIFLILFILSSIYMKKRLGLKASEYSEEEVKYSDIPIKN